MYIVLMNALLEMYTTGLTSLSVLCSLLIMECHSDAVLYIRNRCSALHLLIAAQKRMAFSAGRRVFTEALDAAPGKLIDQ